MSFTQLKLDRSSDQSRGIFNKYVYETDDTIDEVISPGYFAQSRFIALDSDSTNSMGWANGFMDIVSNGLYYFGQISSDGLSVALVYSSLSLYIDPVIHTSSFEVSIQTRHATDTTGTAGTFIVTIPPNWPIDASFRIQDVAGSWDGTDTITVDFIGSGYMYNGLSQNYTGAIPNDGRSFILRNQAYGFELL